MTLDDLVAALRSAYGDALQAVVLYGSAAAGQHVERRSDYNVLVLVQHIDVDALERVGGSTDAWMHAGNPPPLTLTAAEWRSSADIFPMEYADVLSRHRVLHGTLPLDGVAVSPRDLRLQVEHEAMATLLRLRRAIAAAGAVPAREIAILEQSLGTFMAVFRGALRLDGGESPTDHEEVCRELARRVGFDPYPFVKAVHHRRGAALVTEGEARELLGGYLSGLEALVTYLNAHHSAATPS
jgi:hypothetical protein